MNTQGSGIILMVFEILIVVLVVGMTFSVAKAYSGSEGINKILYAGELEMMVNTLAAVPGAAVVEFPYNASSYVVVFDSSEIRMYLKTEEHTPLVWERRQVHLPGEMKLAGVAKGVERLCLTKNDFISVGDCRE